MEFWTILFWLVALFLFNYLVIVTIALKRAERKAKEIEQKTLKVLQERADEMVADSRQDILETAQHLMKLKQEIQAQHLTKKEGGNHGT